MKMNKSKLCFLLTALLAGIFIVKNPLDYLVYSNTLNSAPFGVSIMVNAIYFLLPALIALICGCLFRRKEKKTA